MEKIEYTITEMHSPDAKCRGTLADLMLDSFAIPRCGLIPPYPVLRSFLRTGGGDSGMGPGCVWDPFDLSEEDYWLLVENLERMTSDDFKFRRRDPHIIGEIRPDYAAPGTDSYEAWQQSLVNRGFLPGGPDRQTRR